MASSTEHQTLGISQPHDPNALAWAILNEELLRAEHLLSTPGAADVNFQDEQGRTPLLLACYKGWTEGVLLLLRHGAKKDLTDKNGRCPLHAITYSHSVSVLTALTKGCGEGDLNVRDNEGMTAAHWAAFHSQPEMLNSLVGLGVNALALDIDSKTALHWAAQNNCVGCVNVLLEHPHCGRRLIGMMDIGGKSALHCAAAAGSAATLRRLSQAAECNIECRDNEKRTPLHWAAGIGRSEIVRLLLDLNADPLATDSLCKTPLAYASNAGHLECVSIMERFVRHNIIEAATKKWSDKASGNDAVQSAEASALHNRSSLQVRAVAASLSSLRSSLQFMSDPQCHAFKQPSSCSIESLKDEKAIKHEAYSASRTGTLDDSEQNTAFLVKRSENGGRGRNTLAPLQKLHKNQETQNFNATPPSSDGSVITLNHISGVESVGAAITVEARVHHLNRRRRQRRHYGAGSELDRGGVSDSDLSTKGSEESGLRGVGIGSWPSMDSFAEATEPIVAHRTREYQRVESDGEVSIVSLGEPSVTGGPVCLPVHENGLLEAISIDPKKPTKVRRKKHKVYPHYQKPTMDTSWTELDEAQIIKYLSSDADATLV